MIGSAARGFRLIVEAGDAVGTIIASAGELVTIGRGGTLELSDPAVHCAVETRGGRVIVRGSEGALLDGVAILEACARHGSILVLGATRIRIELGDAVAGVLPGDDLVPAIDGTQPWQTQRDGWMRYAERKYVESALIAAHYNVSEAAKLAGMNRASFYRMMWRAGIRSGACRRTSSCRDEASASACPSSDPSSRPADSSAARP